MMKMNRCEAEIDKIRLQLYEETKHMTPDEHARRTNELAQKVAAQYGFTIGTPTSRTKTPVPENTNR
jgi:NAD(P)H-dependent FMN reductase